MSAFLLKNFNFENVCYSLHMFKPRDGVTSKITIKVKTSDSGERRKIKNITLDTIFLEDNK